MPTVSAILKAIQNPTRRKIIDQLGEELNPVAYSDFLPLVDYSTGKLNYHLRILGDILDKRDDGYLLSDKGKRIARWMDNLVSEGEISTDRPNIVVESLRPVNNLRWKFDTLVSLFVILSIIAIWLLSYTISIPLYLYSILLLIWTTGIIGSHLYYNSIWYNIADTEVEVFKGVITQTHKIVPYRTIVNIEVKAGIFDRIFNIATIEIHTAGYSQQGAEERIIGMINADEIKETILERIRLLNPPEFIHAERGIKPVLDELRVLNSELRGD